MPTLNEYFDAVYCINLARRTDRWKHVVEQCKKHTLAVERFDAYADVPDHTGKPNAVCGCTASHRAVLDIIAHRGHSRALILEDDFEFRFDHTQELFSEMVGEVPADWEILWLGGNHADKLLGRVSKHVLRAGRIIGTHAYGVTRQFARTYGSRVSGGAGIDSIYSDWSNDRKFYIFQPRLAVQMPSFSDIRQNFADDVGHYIETSRESQV